MDPNPYAVIEPELLRTLRLFRPGGFLRDHPWFSAFSGTVRIAPRPRLAPPRSNRGPSLSFSIVPGSSPLRPSVPPRPTALKCLDQTPTPTSDCHDGSSKTVSTGHYF